MGGISAARIVAAAREWIGTPYVHQASVKGVGCDCLGLLRGVWRESVGSEPEAMQPYSPDWSDATGEETLYAVLQRHLDEIACADLAPGDIAVFRVVPHGPAKHCGIIGSLPLPERGRSSREAARVGVVSGRSHDDPPDRFAIRPSLFKGGNAFDALSLIHTRQNKRVSEEPFSPAWRKKLAFAFRMR